MLETIRKRKLKYVGHACRHTDSQLMINTLQGKTQSARRKGRPTTSYIGNITKSLGATLQEITHRSQDRTEWRQMIESTSMGAATIATDEADR